MSLTDDDCSPSKFIDDWLWECGDRETECVPDPLRRDFIRLIKAWNRRATWQPIETAPKDGSSITLANAAKSISGFWHSKDSDWLSNELVPCAIGFEPTHWMPLPEPPKGGAE